MRLAAPPLLLCAGLTLTACGLVLGFPDSRELDVLDDAGSSGDSSASEDAVEPAPGAPGLVCAPPAPEGFQGPVAIFEGSGNPAPSPPDCLPRHSVAYDGAGNPSAPAPACTCQCVAPTTGVSCAEPVANFFRDSTCTTPCGAPNQIIPTMNTAATAGCGGWDETGCNVGAPWVQLSVAKVKGPPCVANLAGTAPPPVSWSASVRLCAPTPDVTASCPGVKVPIPASTLPYEPGNYCVASRSVTTCPSAYPAKRVYFDPDRFEDTRACKRVLVRSDRGLVRRVREDLRHRLELQRRRKEHERAPSGLFHDGRQQHRVRLLGERRADQRLVQARRWRCERRLQADLAAHRVLPALIERAES